MYDWAVNLRRIGRLDISLEWVPEDSSSVGCRLGKHGRSGRVGERKMKTCLR